MYNEAIATMALAKSFELTRNRYWNEPAQKGIEFIEAAQRLSPSGDGLWGWRYESRRTSKRRALPSAPWRTRRSRPGA
jgi:hypothetical protein